MCDGQGREICEEWEEAERPVSGSGEPFLWVTEGNSVSDAGGALVVWFLYRGGEISVREMGECEWETKRGP